MTTSIASEVKLHGCDDDPLGNACSINWFPLWLESDLSNAASWSDSQLSTWFLSLGSDEMDLRSVLMWTELAIKVLQFSSSFSTCIFINSKYLFLLEFEPLLTSCNKWIVVVDKKVLHTPRSLKKFFIAGIRYFSVRLIASLVISPFLLWAVAFRRFLLGHTLTTCKSFFLNLSP